MNREGGIVREIGKVDVQMVVVVMGWQMTKDPFRQCCDGDRSYRVERPADRRSRLKLEKSSRRRDGYSFISILAGVSSLIKYDRVDLMTMSRERKSLSNRRLRAKRICGRSVFRADG